MAYSSWRAAVGLFLLHKATRSEAGPARGACYTDLKWYAPAQSQINNLDDVVNGKGIYGWIYNSSETAKEEYGVYNWCNMPHVRSDIYEKADKDFELIYVELIHRHHKRTPYSSNSFPVEPYQWNCDDVHLHNYGQPASEEPPAAEVYRQGYISDVNPFVPRGWIGSCQFPQITEGGLVDSWQHGKDLYDVYGKILGFLPEKKQDWKDKVRYRVTNNLITSQVAGMVLNGEWDVTDAYPLKVQAEGVDSLEPQYSCPKGSQLFNNIQSNQDPAWQEHRSRAASLYATLDDISGVPPNDGGFHKSFDHYYDNLSARQCHDKPLPCKLVNGQNSTTCVTQETAEAVYRMGNWEYSRIYRDNPQSLAASVATFGVWIGELSNHIRDAMHGNSEVKYFHNVAHDGSISRLLSILQVEEMFWPGMGAEVVFELYKKKTESESDVASRSMDAVAHKSPMVGLKGRGTQEEKFFVRILFGGKVLKSSSPALQGSDLLPIGRLLNYFDGLVGQGASKVAAKCNGDLPL